VKLERLVFGPHPEALAPFREGYGPPPPLARERFSLGWGLELLGMLALLRRRKDAPAADRCHRDLLDWSSRDAFPDGAVRF
jgi:MYXO-CTERM domain-containing protein